MALRSSSLLLILVAALLSLAPQHASAQIDPAVRDRVIPGAIQIAFLMDVIENGIATPVYVPVGSGTVISPGGLILTNWHVVDSGTHRAELDLWEAENLAAGIDLRFDLLGDAVVILTADPARPPEPAYIAEIVATDEALDLAVLRIVADGNGSLEPVSLALSYVPLGDSASLQLGDPIDVFSFPAIGGDALTYTTGVVSGFNFAEGLDGPAWITTDATMSGGSSGGTAVDRTGALIGVPTQGGSLDCRPSDSNRDGRITAEDVGCIPTGGSIGQVRPINLARALLDQAGVAVTELLEQTARDDPPDVIDAAPAPHLPTPVPTGIWLPPTDAEIAAQQALTEETCATSPLYPVGTVIEALSTSTLENPDGWEHLRGVTDAALVVPGTLLRITGPVIEAGVCDRWPVEVVWVPPPFDADTDNMLGGVAWAGDTGTVAEVVFQALTILGESGGPIPGGIPAVAPTLEEVAAVCAAAPEDYFGGYQVTVRRHTTLVLADDSSRMVLPGTEVMIGGPKEAREPCDLWPVEIVSLPIDPAGRSGLARVGEGGEMSEYAFVAESSPD